jgi:hypothetical protein
MRYLALIAVLMGLMWLLFAARALIGPLIMAVWQIHLRGQLLLLMLLVGLLAGLASAKV